MSMRFGQKGEILLRSDALTCGKQVRTVHLWDVICVVQTVTGHGLMAKSFQDFRKLYEVSSNKFLP